MAFPVGRRSVAQFIALVREAMSSAAAPRV